MLDSNEIKDICRNLGADLVGIADAGDFRLSAPGHAPADKLPGARSVVAMACRFPFEAMEMPTVEYTAVRNSMVEKMNSLAKSVSVELKKMGIKSKVVNSIGGSWDDGYFRGHISLKYAASLVGLGIIGRNNLLITPQYGNMVWLSAVISDSPLPQDRPLAGHICGGDCGLCVRSCPSGALDDPDNFGQRLCRRTCYVTVKGRLDLKCWRCRQVCPHRFGFRVAE